MRKLRIGWFTFTCSGDNSIILIELMNEHFFEWKEKIEFVHCKMLKGNNELENLDVAFVEGAISGQKNENELKEIRKNAKKVVAIGACAISGLPAGQRNSFSKEQMAKITPFLKLHNLKKRVEPIKKFVKVDKEIPGCPMNEEIFLDVLKKYMHEFGIE